MVVVGVLVGGVAGLAVGLADPAWAAYSMLLGAFAGAAAAAGAIALGAVADWTFRGVRAEARHVAVAVGAGLGAAAALLALAQVFRIVPPWSTLVPLTVLVLVSTLTLRRRLR